MCISSPWEGFPCGAAIRDEGCGRAQGIESESSCRCSGEVYVTRHLSQANTLGFAGCACLYECVLESYTERSYVSNVFFFHYMHSCIKFCRQLIVCTLQLIQGLCIFRGQFFPSCPHSGMFSQGHANQNKINLGTDASSNPTAAAVLTRLTLLGSHKHLSLTRWAVSPMLAASLTDYRGLTLISLPSPNPSLLFSPVMMSLSLSLQINK